MTYEIQPAVQCENCMKCGSRPVIEQTKKNWLVRCPNKACANEVAGSVVDIEQWNRKNKPQVALNQKSALKNIA